MSAFIVSEDHINVIVSYFVDYRKDYQLWFELNGKFGYMDEVTAPVVAQVLYSENVRSVNERYNDTQSDEVFQPKYLPQVKQLYTIGEIAQALDCLQYQSCESDDYYTTDAYKVITNMRKHLLKKVADEEGSDVWEITEVKKSNTVRIA